VGKVNVNFCGKGRRVASSTDPHGSILGFLDWRHKSMEKSGIELENSINNFFYSKWVQRVKHWKWSKGLVPFSKRCDISIKSTRNGELKMPNARQTNH
jgi:hypothetical protein